MPATMPGRAGGPVRRAQGESAPAASHPVGAESAPAYSLPGDVPFYAPDRPADVVHIDIGVTLDMAARRVEGDVTTHFLALFDAVRVVRLDAAEFDIHQVTLAPDDTPLAWWTEGEQLCMRLDRTYTYGEQFAVRVRYTARPRAGLTFVQPSEGDPDLPIQVWTQGETEYHHFWFPCHDFPNDRATTQLSATVPGDFFVLSNGVLQGVEDHPDGTKTYVWRMDVPFPAYLVTLVAGTFATVQDAWRDVPVPYYVRPGREDDARRAFGKTPAMIDFFSARFGLDYPYPKYAQVVAEMFTGAMENASATTNSYRLLPDIRASLDYSPESTVAHELTHQWFGDLIAVRDWAHTWLKESFATYFAAAWKQHDLGQDEFQLDLRSFTSIYAEADATQGRRPIVYNIYRKNGNELFDRNNYQKGARVLHMLRFVVGEEAFWRGIQHYARRNAGREVITSDLERAVEEATGHSLARFFAQWVYRAGHPEFTVSYAWDDERHMACLTVRQTQRVTEMTPIFATPVEVGFFVPDTNDARAEDADAPASLVTLRIEVDQADQTFYLPLARQPLSVRFDQGSWLLKTLDFERPSALLRYQLRHDPDVLGRIEAAEALGKLGDMASEIALQHALAHDPFWAVRAEVASALAARKSSGALESVLAALAQEQHAKARRGIVAALGEFHAPEQASLAVRAADALAELLAHGDPSYYVEASAATALGKTHTPQAFERLEPLLRRDSWLEIVRGGVFAGLGALGDPRAVDVLAAWVVDRSKPMDARWGAAGGLRALAATGRVEGEPKARAVDALVAALDDPWIMVVRAAIGALREWGDARALPALWHLATTSLEEHTVREARETIRALTRRDRGTRELARLRDDMETLRDEDRDLRARLAALEARLDEATPGAPGADDDASGNGAPGGGARAPHPRRADS